MLGASQRGEQSAGFDLRQLAGVADEHDLRVLLGGGLEQLQQLAGADHAGFVDHDHGALRQLNPAQVAEEPGERCGGDPGAVLQFAGGYGGEAGAHDGVASFLPGLAGGAQRSGLARAGGTDDDVHP